MYCAGILYARAGPLWPVPWQLLARPRDSHNVSSADLNALSLLHLNAGTKIRNTHCRTTGPVASRPVHLFGSLEGLRVTGLLENTKADQDHIAPYLIPAGCEAEFLQQRANIRGQVLLAGNLASSVSLITYWLQKCIESHRECQSDPSTDPWLIRPRRMVDLIDYQQLEDNSRVRVVESKWPDEPYCALSYRWPSVVDSLAILTPQSKGRLLAGVHPKLLHRVIRDACTLCHKLGFRYLWVDALCIVQGDEGDWHAEAEKISSIYLNATCTIASIDGTSLQNASQLALRSSLCDEKMLRELIPTSCPCSPEQIYMALQKSGNFTGRPDGELDTRAWAFQEKILSRRIISITKDGIFWDCLHYSASGIRPTGILGDFSPNFRDTDDRKFKAVLLGRPWLSIATNEELYWYWRKAVQEYTKRKITRGRDRLIALQGVIAKLKVTLSDECVLGIWRSNAARCLAWFVDSNAVSEDESHAKRPVDKTAVRAPSWSWVSVCHPIQYRLYHHFAKNLERKTERLSEMVTVQELTMRSKTNNGFDDFEGRLRLQGATLKGLLVEGRVYIINRSSSAPNLDDLPEDGYGTKESWLETLKFHSSSGTAEKVFIDTQCLVDNARPSNPDAATVPLPDWLDRRTFTHDDEIEAQSPIGNRATSWPEEVTCLLLFEGSYGNTLSARYFVVLSPCERRNMGALADLGIIEYYKDYFSQRGSQKPTSFRRIGLCAFDRRQICQESAQHDLFAMRPCPCLGKITTLDII